MATGGIDQELFYLNDGKLPRRGGNMFDSNTYPTSTGSTTQPKNAYQFDMRAALTGVKQGLGGTDQFGNPLPGMIPGGGVIAGLGQVAGGAMDLINYKKRMGEQGNNLFNAIDDQKKFFQREKAGLYDPKVAQAQRDLAMAGVRPTDTSGIASASQTAFNAMQGDPRLAASQMGSIMRNQAQMTQQQKMADVNREIASMSNLANLEQSALDQKIGLDRELGLMGLGRAQQAEATSRNNIEAIRDSRRQAFGNIVGGLVNTGIGVASGFKDGGQVQKTPGEFSHASNPIDIMKDGAKVGEMTGGEYILNPKQANEIKSARDSIKRGSRSPQELNKLYEVIDKILSQPQFS